MRHHKEDAHLMPLARKVSVASFSFLHKYLMLKQQTATRPNQMGTTTWSAILWPILHRKLLSLRAGCAPLVMGLQQIHEPFTHRAAISSSSVTILGRRGIPLRRQSY